MTDKTERKTNQLQNSDHKMQFSKRLARYGAVVWAIYSFAVLALIAYQPEAAMACVWLTLIMTANKAIDTVSYTHNSTQEKILLAAIERTQLELSLKGIGRSISSTKKTAKTGTNESEESEDVDEDSEDEGGGNG